MTFSGAEGDPVTSAKAGDTVRFKVTPDSGYTLGTVTVKTETGAPVAFFVSGGVYSFKMPAIDAVVTAGHAIDVPVAAVNRRKKIRTE